nr:MAG TPA: Protein phosphatase inhibitor [Caudoviricetes sp.]
MNYSIYTWVCTHEILNKKQSKFCIIFSCVYA